MAVKLKDIAASLGVSVSTVSCVIRGEGRVSEETRSRVLEAVRNSDYVPNESARWLRGVDNMTIAVVVPTFIDNYFSTMVAAFERIAAKRNYLLSVFSCENSEERQKDIIRQLQSKPYSGILHSPMTHDCDIYDKYLSNPDSVPMVFFNIPPQTELSYNYSAHDHFEAAYLLTDHLIRLGHRRIAFISSGVAVTRRAGFLRCLKDNGIEPYNLPDDFIGDNTVADGERLTSALFKNDDNPSAVIASNNNLTFGALKYLKEHHYSIPSEISLAGFDAIDPTGLITPALTVVCQDYDRIAENAVEMVANNTRNEIRILKPTLVIGDSTAVYRPKI